MATKIIDLPLATTLVAADQIPIYSAANGDARRIPASALATLVAADVPAVGTKTPQFAAPSATGFTVTIDPPTEGDSMWLVLTPVAAYATGAIVLPGTGEAVEGQEIDVTTTQAVTTLTVSASGLTVTGAPTTLAQHAVFRMRYDSVNSTWRIAP